MSGWKAGAGDLEGAIQAFLDAIVRRDAVAMVEAAGRRVVLDDGAGVAAWAKAHTEAARAAAEVAAEADLASLEDAAVALRALLDRRAEGAVSLPDLERGVREALGPRDRVELGLLGAAAFLGKAPEPSPAQESAILVFESLVRPALWRLTEANEARREALAWMAPRYRPSFWWWSEGADVAPHALAALPAVAHLCARFPSAAGALRALVSAQEAWDEAGAAGRAAPVVSLGAWVARRAAEARPHPLPLAAAAAGDEITLIDRPDVQVSWSPPDALVVDLVADRAPGATPSLRLADGAVVPSEPVAGAEERFRLPAGARLLAEGRVVLVLPLAGGTLEIPLPP